MPISNGMCADTIHGWAVALVKAYHAAQSLGNGMGHAECLHVSVGCGCAFLVYLIPHPLAR